MKGQKDPINYSYSVQNLCSHRKIFYDRTTADRIMTGRRRNAWRREGRMNGKMRKNNEKKVNKKNGKKKRAKTKKKKKRKLKERRLKW